MQISAAVTEADGVKVAASVEHGLTEEQAASVTSALKAAGSVKVHAVDKGSRKRTAIKPYITSTLQQDAANLLRMSIKVTMDAAQGLFEGESGCDTPASWKS